jgi:hypothetical protein
MGTSANRWRGLAAVVLLSVWAAGVPPAQAQRGEVADAVLQAFGRELGLVDIEGFVAAVRSLDRTGKLPSRYVTKTEAEKLGWRPGRPLSSVAPGRAIGGDRFMNRERRLPTGSNLTYWEADLDYDSGPRNAKRLVWSSQGRRWVTVDHYESFREVP